MDQIRLDALQTEWQTDPQEERTRLRRLPLKAVVLLPKVFQCRPDCNLRNGVTKEGKQHVAVMAAHLKRSNSNDLDAITIIRVGGRNVLTDGHHRFAAYKVNKRPDIPVRYFTQGGPRAALLAGGAENQKAKLTLSAAERSQWAWTLVISRAYTKAEIRLASRASDGNVGNMRRRLSELEVSGVPIPTLWSDVNLRKYEDEEEVTAQAKEWAAKITQAIGPPKTFKTLGKKHMLVDALVLWSPRLAGELAMLLAEEMDLKDQVEQYVQNSIEELGEERLQILVTSRAEKMLIEEGRMEAPAF